MPRTHKTLPRLYVETALLTGAEVALDKDQTNHLVNVLRRGPGVGRRIFIALSAAVQLGLALYLTSQVIGKEPMVLHLGDWGALLGVVLVLDGLAGIMLCLSTFVSLMCVLFSYAEIPVWSEQPLRLPLMQCLWRSRSC